MLKYIQTRQRGYILFESAQSHKDMFAKLDAPNSSDELISAGFVYLDECSNPPTLRCRGESTSLMVGSKTNDGPALTNKLQL